MKTLLLLLSLISPPSFAATPGAVPSVTVSAPGANTGSVSISPAMLSGTGVNGIFSLYVGGTLTAGNYYPLYRNGVAYQVTSGKTAYCFDITSLCTNASYSGQLFSATASFASGAASITGGVYQCGVTPGYCIVSSPTASTTTVVPGVYSFGSGTYPGFVAYTGSTPVWQLHMDCFEQ